MGLSAKNRKTKVARTGQISTAFGPMLVTAAGGSPSTWIVYSSIYSIRMYHSSFNSNMRCLIALPLSNGKPASPWSVCRPRSQRSTALDGRGSRRCTRSSSGTCRNLNALTTTVTSGATALGGPSSAKWLASSSAAGICTLVLPASAAATAPTRCSSRFPAASGVCAPVAIKSERCWPPRRSRTRSAPRCRTGSWCLLSPNVSAPTPVTTVASSAGSLSPLGIA